MRTPKLLFRCFAITITSLCLHLLIPDQVQAQTGSEQYQQILAGKQLRIASQTRLSSRLHLIAAHYQLEKGLAVTALVSDAEMALNFDRDQYLDPLSQMVGIRIQTEQPAQLLNHLLNIGFVFSASVPEHGIMEGYLDPAQILLLDDLTGYGLISATAFTNPENDTGSVGSQADTVLQAYRVRGTAPDNFDGTGVSVGVLSDSYDLLGGAAAGMSSGDLPGTVTVIQDNGSSDEGRAMLEIVHDLAPGASLFFATANGGEANYAANIQALATAGCGVIVDDVVYLEEPFFQDGIIAQAVDNVTTVNDAIYFSSAGNRADRAYENTSPAFSAEAIFSNDALDFDSGVGVDHFQQFTLNDGEQFRAVLQWDDPWYTIAGVDTDIDFIITDDPPTMVLASGVDDNIATQIPSEFLSFTDGTADALPNTYNVYIVRFAGPVPGRLKYVNFGTHNLNEFATNSPTVNPHAAAAGCVAVAATPYWDGVTESFSSHGPSTFLFSSTGVPLGSPQVRQKPDLAASDGANNTFFGSDFEGDGFPNFFGTSSAAPHAAAVAALLREAFPASNRNAIYATLTGSATDIGTAGTDNISGAGIIDAYRAIYPTITPASLDFSDGLETANFSRAWELNYPGAGRMRPSTAFTPATGTNHLIMDAWFDGFFSVNEAILHFDATGATNINLSFDQKESGDEDNAMPLSFSGSVNADGVALSVDGTNWFRLFDLTAGNSTNTYANKTINLSTFATANALSLGGDVQIKFQQFDNFAFPADGFAYDNINISGTILPVNLLSFSAIPGFYQDVLVEWQTAQEIENDVFLLERSRNGKDFERLHQIKGAGTIYQAQSYQFLDSSPYSGLNYYRLWQIDKSGQKTLSQTVTVWVDGGTVLSVFPNPIDSRQLSWQYQSAGEGRLRLRVLDTSGRTILLKNQSVIEGLHSYHLNIDHLSAGLYWLESIDQYGQRSMATFIRL